MQHIRTSDKTFLIGNEVAELLMEYAALTAQINSGDTVTIRAFGADGDEVVATLLLNSGTVMTSESVHTSMNEPENAEATAYLRERLASYREPPMGYPVDEHDGEV